jgi:hypothetical protein
MLLAALPATDRERSLAAQHAATCLTCAKALSEGSLLLELVDAQLQPTPSPAALFRAERAVLDEMARHRERPPLKARLLFAGAVAASFGAALAIAPQRLQDPSRWGAAAAAGVVAAALGALAPAGRRILWIALLASLALAFALSGTGLVVGAGVRCFGIVLSCALAPLALSTVAPAELRIEVPAVGGAFAAAAALAAQASLHVTCPSRALPHLVGFHVAGVVLATFLGSRLVALRRA